MRVNDKSATSVWFVVCRSEALPVSIPYWSRAKAREGLAVLRGERDGRGPLKGHTRRCLRLKRYRSDGMVMSGCLL